MKYGCSSARHPAVQAVQIRVNRASLENLGNLESQGNRVNRENPNRR